MLAPPHLHHIGPTLLAFIPLFKRDVLCLFRSLLRARCFFSSLDLHFAFVFTSLLSFAFVSCNRNQCRGVQLEGRIGWHRETQTWSLWCKLLITFVFLIGCTHARLTVQITAFSEHNHAHMRMPHTCTRKHMHMHMHMHPHTHSSGDAHRNARRPHPRLRPRTRTHIPTLTRSHEQRSAHPPTLFVAYFAFFYFFFAFEFWY